jgi:hypothetical protein
LAAFLDRDGLVRDCAPLTARRVGQFDAIGTDEASATCSPRVTMLFATSESRDVIVTRKPIPVDETLACVWNFERIGITVAAQRRFDLERPRASI